MKGKRKLSNKLIMRKDIINKIMKDNYKNIIVFPNHSMIFKPKTLNLLRRILKVSLILVTLRIRLT